MNTVKIEVYGRVQGVNFRNNVKGFCDSVGIKGRAMNLESGSVKITVQCSKKELMELMGWIEKNPGLARVDRVEVAYVTTKEIYDDFRVVKEYSYLKDKEKALGNLLRHF